MNAQPAQATAPRKPNVFLVGAPKAGTTSLARVLAAHPDFFMSPIKEPCHFCTDVRQQLVPWFEGQRQMDLAAYLDSPVREPVHFHLVHSAADYARLYEGAGDQPLVGECSTQYLSSHDAARNIAAYAPDARIIMIFREPVERILSHHTMEVSQGRTVEPLLRLVEKERALGAAAHWGNSCFYLGTSRYLPQLRRYLAHFPASQVCVLSFERLCEDPNGTLRHLFDFLGLPPDSAPAELPRANGARTPRFPRANRLLRASGLRPWLGRQARAYLPEALRQRLAASFFPSGKPRVPDDVRARLEAIVREEGLREEWLQALALGGAPWAGVLAAREGAPQTAGEDDESLSRARAH
jgi:hypothetical protein